MRKRLLRAFWIGNALTLMLVLVFVSVMVVSDIQSDLGSLKAILNTASSWTLEATSNLQELADQIAASTDNLRVTFLMPSGIILADSEKEEQDGQALSLLRHGGTTTVQLVERNRFMRRTADQTEQAGQQDDKGTAQHGHQFTLWAAVGDRLTRTRRWLPAAAYHPSKRRRTPARAAQRDTAPALAGADKGSLRTAWARR